MMPDTPTVLLVCDDHSLTRAVEQAVSPVSGLHLEVVEDARTACSRVEHRSDVVLAIAHLGGAIEVAGVTQLLRTISVSGGTPLPVLTIDEEHNAERALALLQLGVSDCLARPLDISRLSYLADVLSLQARYGVRAPEPNPERNRGDIVDEGGFIYDRTSKMGRLMEQVHRIARREATILLGGETGTGKSVLAKLIHRLSPRSEQPFLAINCGALSATLIESEMFGHVKGAFTGADADRVGKFAEVGQGTLFLDEVDSLPMGLQAKLLRAVEERVFEPVGTNKTQKMQARLVVASNRPLDREVAEGRFRADLYYRLNVVAFDLPPLRERTSAIPAIARRFLEDLTPAGEPAIRGFSDEARRALQAHPWPGNIRELRNVVERAVALSPGPLIQLDDLPEALKRPASARVEAPAAAPAGRGVTDTSLARSRENAERSHIVEALKKHRNNRLRAAAELGISRMTLYNKLRKFGMMDLAF